ncbi:MAG: hypothetical protein IKO30_04525 [Lachnospiraceae bacterium]|nr:hypothetical protein [Lachnospiraceae bacterium]
MIDGVVSPDDEATEDYPCQMTMERWLVWFRINIRRIEGYLRQISTSLHMNLDPASLLNNERNKPQNRWLEKIQRAIYNSGGSLSPG